MQNGIKIMYVPIDTGDAFEPAQQKMYIEFVTPKVFSERYPEALSVIEKNGVANFYTRNRRQGVYYEVRCQVVVGYGLFGE